MRYFEKCVISGSCLHLTVQKFRLWSYQKVIRLSSLIQSKLLEIIVDYIRGEQLPKNDLTGSTGFAVLRPKYDRDASLIYLAATDQATIEVLANLADGGAYPAVRPEVVSARKIVLAPDDLLLAFSQEVFPLIAKIEIGKDENQTLAALRDTLLPRLMSGELRVGEAREQVEERI